MGPKKARNIDIAGSSGASKKRVGTGSRRQDGILFKDARQKKRYESLSKMVISPTRYPPFEPTRDTTFGCLGIEENCVMMFERLGWMNFLESSWDTYVQLTLEFLSSIQFDEDKTITSTPNHQLSFRLFNGDFNLSLTEFADILGFQNSGLIHDSKNPAFKPEDFDENAFWGLITGQRKYEPRTAKASRIHNPVFRYVHRTMAHTIFARPETGTVNSAELFMLWAMVNSRPVNTSYYMVKYLAHLADKRSGIISVGGIVSFITSKLGLEDTFEQMEGIGHLKIDYEYCCLINLIEPASKNSRRHSYLLISRQRSIKLPNPERNETTNPANWLYPLAAEVNQSGDKEQIQEEELAEPSTPHAPPSQSFNMEAWGPRIEGELQRQGAELQLIREDQLLHSQQMEHMSDMLQTLMRHFNLNQAPPPEQQ